MRINGRGVWRGLASSLALLPLALLGGCASSGVRLFDPRGPVAAASWRYTLIDVAVMLLLILPITVLIAVFIFRYRKTRNAAYDPDWSHSMWVEFLVWGLPVAIVAMLAFFSYYGVRETNPYGPAVLEASEHGPVGTGDPLEIDVIATDWQWFFVYPKQRIATIDELVIPAGARIETRLTSTSVTNDFFIPQIAPMIDVMPGMQTRDVFQADHAGVYEGFSADFSGAGFAWMQFATRVVSADEFKSWADGVRRGQSQPDRGSLTYAAFQKLAHPTLNFKAAPSYFSSVDPTLFDMARSAAIQGVVYPVPGDITETMTPKAAPHTSKASGT